MKENCIISHGRERAKKKVKMHFRVSSDCSNFCFSICLPTAATSVALVCNDEHGAISCFWFFISFSDNQERSCDFRIYHLHWPRTCVACFLSASYQNRSRHWSQHCTLPCFAPTPATLPRICIRMEISPFLQSRISFSAKFQHDTFVIMAFLRYAARWHIGNTTNHVHWLSRRRVQKQFMLHFFSVVKVNETCCRNGLQG